MTDEMIEECARYCISDDTNCSMCEMLKHGCLSTFAGYIARNANKEESISISDMPDYSSAEDFSGVAFYEFIKETLNEMIGDYDVVSVNADLEKLMMEFTHNGSAYTVEFSRRV